jgi:CrcB protein
MLQSLKILFLEIKKTMVNYLIIIISGIAGMFCRWSIANYFNAYASYIPLGLLVVNSLGCFIAGVVLGLVQTNVMQSTTAIQAIIIGFLGCLTTFSGFSLEVIEQFIAGNSAQAVSIALIHPVLAIVMTGLGFFIITRL